MSKFSNHEYGHKKLLLEAFKSIGEAFKDSVDNEKFRYKPTWRGTSGITLVSHPSPLGAFYPTRIGNYGDFLQNGILQDVEQLALAMVKNEKRFG